VKAAVRRLLGHVLGVCIFTSGVLFSLSDAAGRGVGLRVLILSLLGGIANYGVYRCFRFILRDEHRWRGRRRWLGLAALVVVGSLPVVVFVLLLRLA